ncbi:hypothetical protein [Roseivivax lentus]|uniref:hypothetical protein n=1 Tax=Roseivivax lentus TaxID=633194 RepID=UPI00190EABF9|nr:hypothetical protein [Roseivivax lentus]
MAASAQVTWAATSGDTGSDAQKIGGVVKRFFGNATWQLAPEEAIACIEQDEWSFFVELEGERYWLVVEETDGDKKKLSLAGDAEVEAVFASLPDVPDQ